MGTVVCVAYRKCNLKGAGTRGVGTRGRAGGGLRGEEDVREGCYRLGAGGKEPVEKSKGEFCFFFWSVGVRR